MTDLGLFDSRPGDERPNESTGSVDVSELRAALAKGAVDKAPAEPAPKKVPPARQLARERREQHAKRRRRRRRHTLVALLVLVLLAGGITAGFLLWQKKQNVIPEFAGAAGPQVIVRVQDSDSRTDVAQRLADAGVVASVQTFLNATVNDGDVANIQPGYYRLPTHLSAADAADALVDKSNRVGQMQVVPGRNLADAPTKNGTKTPGYISQITAAACVPLNQTSHCFTSDDLWTVAETGDLSTLNIPEWAVEDVAKAPDASRRLEGLIRPGNYNVPPTASPHDALASVLSQSSALWSTSDVVAGAAQQGVTPYQAVVVASLVEREAIAPDMGKVAQVIYNRYGQRMKLQLDSTINYAFGRTTVATTAADRSKDSPYNTYLRDGLPPTPIDSPSTAALEAALNPTDGPWLYFVVIDKNGNSCFSMTFADHSKCVAQARKNGVL